MKPASLAVGNTLTLLECAYGIRQRNETEWQWKPNLTHKGLGIPRLVVSARSKFIEIGDQRSRLDYPKASEYIETPETLTITYVEDGGGTTADTGVRLVYRVERIPH